MLFPNTTLNCKGRLIDLTEPKVMGILNVTPDSFFDGGRYDFQDAAMKQVEKMLSEGAFFIDVGGMSSRPGAAVIDEKEELGRVLPVVEAISKNFPETIISIDTWRAGVAKACVEAGATIVNDISAGRLDESLLETVAKLEVPYILMHMQGTPQNMQANPDYDDVLLEVLDFFIQKVEKLREFGIKDIILDPGFGFGKTIEHNFTLLKNLHAFRILELPILAGLSRKSMIYKLLDIQPTEALPATEALHMVALQQGAKIIRAHDVKEAVHVIQLWKQLEVV